MTEPSAREMYDEWRHLDDEVHVWTTEDVKRAQDILAGGDVHVIHGLTLTTATATFDAEVTRFAGIKVVASTVVPPGEIRMIRTDCDNRDA